MAADTTLSSSSPSSSLPPPPPAPPSLSTCLLAGGLAGSAVDVILFPLDTLKTRLQSSTGLRESGGLCRLYSGIAPTLLGSAPSAALFFLTYESLKQACSLWDPALGDSPWTHLLSASLAEVSACTVRVPIEVVKQRMQILRYQKGLLSACRLVFQSDGVLGFYRGFQATLQREIPFSCIQFPLYEYLKRTLLVSDERTAAWKMALCGSLAGGMTGALTTPLDVIKTRTILGHRDEVRHLYGSPWTSVQSLLREGGLRRLFAGVVPRTLWISLGGFIFFGAYERGKQLLQP